ncbi:MAG: hypothetical protein F6K30_13220 [Cyanothece sp. SIO2G6]|nr:hypothetical protein [Cyanothece sp. SIO2G6]
MTIAYLQRRTFSVDCVFCRLCFLWANGDERSPHYRQHTTNTALHHWVKITNATQQPAIDANLST